MGRPAKTTNSASTVTTTKKPTTVKTIKETSSNNELDSLKDSVAQLSNMFAMFMQQQMGNQFTPTESTKSVSKQKKATALVQQDNYESIEDVDYVDIQPNKKIRIKSLFDGVLVLNTQEDCQVLNYVFKGFGEVKVIPYSDVSKILNTPSGYSFAQQGLYYIMDKNVVTNHNLDDYYKTILTENTIENFIDFSIEDMTAMFKTITDMQKEQIVSFIAKKLFNKEEIDLNKLAVISRLYGKNIEDMIYIEDENNS